MVIDIFNENLIFIIATMAILIIFLIFLVWRIERRLKRLLGGEKVNIERSLTQSHEKIKDLEGFRNNTENHLSNLEKRLRRSIRAIKTVRFNPFKGTGGGGNQSFSSAFIDEEGSGVVMTGLYHRERISVFAKPLKNFNSDFELSEEEKRALDGAHLDIKEI